jgi:signal transduction histidine kinase
VRKFVLPKFTVSLWLVITATVALIAIGELSFSHTWQATDEIEQTQATRASLNLLVQRLLDAETGQRGYLLTGDNKYLEHYTLAIDNINQNLDELRGMVAPFPPQLAEFGIMSRHVSRKLAELDLTVRMRRENKEEAWKYVMSTDVGREQMEAIRAQSTKLSTISDRKTTQGKALIYQTLMLSRIGIYALAVLGLLGFYMYLRQTKALLVADQREKQSLQLERNRLEAQVRERTVSLAKLATNLQNVREDERSHLARELHDELGALLTAAKLDVARLKTRFANGMPEASDRLEHLGSTLNNVIAMTRRIVEDLRPSALSQLGLLPSLEILVREFEDQSGLTITTDLEPVELGDIAQLTVYRLVQESLTNIGKHAHASEATLSIQNLNGYIAIEVTDNGKGISLDNIAPTSHGLDGMRHRVEAAGGRLTVQNAASGGTHIQAVLPKELSDTSIASSPSM